jgi:hypothetical protein
MISTGLQSGRVPWRCIEKTVELFREGEIDFAQAVQMGNLFASLFIKAPLGDRYGNISPIDRMLDMIHSASPKSHIPDPY